MRYHESANIEVPARLRHEGHVGFSISTAAYRKPIVLEPNTLKKELGQLYNKYLVISVHGIPQANLPHW